MCFQSGIGIIIAIYKYYHFMYGVPIMTRTQKSNFPVLFYGCYIYYYLLYLFYNYFIQRFGCLHILPGLEGYMEHYLIHFWLQLYPTICSMI